MSPVLVLLCLTGVLAQNLPLPELDYSYDALEPYIDEATMKTHHLKHHAAYTDKLNKALSELRASPDHKAIAKQGVDFILNHLNLVPDVHRQTIRNNGGGYVNHALFWKVMTPPQPSTTAADGAAAVVPQPSGVLLDRLVARFGSFQSFQSLFSTTSLSIFGSGWAWLYVDKDDLSLQVSSTSNQDTPVMQGHTPILGLDVWEHAYYLKFKNNRAGYIEAWWNVVNWPYVEQLYTDAAISGRQTQEEKDL